MIYGKKKFIIYKTGEKTNPCIISRNRIDIFFIIAGFLLYAQFVLGQENNIDSIQYDPVKSNLFAEYENAELKIDYFLSEGISSVERYTCEIIVIDTMIMMSFESPETDNMNKIYFEGKWGLTKKQLALLHETLLKANLKQIKEGVPHPNLSGFGQKVLIVTSRDISIAGGMFYTNVFDSPDRDEMVRKRKEDVKNTSSIGGDYESVFKVLESFFPEKDTFIRKAYKGAPELPE